VPEYGTLLNTHARKRIATGLSIHRFIVMDGGSTDCTVEILWQYGKRIKWVSEPDKDHSDAINKG